MLHDRGAVGLVLGGALAHRAVVSQGCRPVGPTMTVTAAEGNLLLGLAGVPAVTKLEELLAGLPPQDQAMVSGGLHLGVAMDEYADEHGPGDFLVRGVVGVDSERGGLVVGDVLTVGQTVQLQVRDAESADLDLTAMLGEVPAGAAGALLFSCTGRGAALFGTRGPRRPGRAGGARAPAVSPGSSRPARSARSAAAATCTRSPPRCWSCSAGDQRHDRRHDRPVLAVDVGGTKLAAALVDEAGQVLRSSSRPTPAADGAAVWSTLVALLDDVAGR